MEYDSLRAYPKSPSFIDLIVMPRGRSRRLPPVPPPQLPPAGLPLIDWADKVAHPAEHGDDTEHSSVEGSSDDARAD
jgi:hypothetical protein